MAGNWNSGRRPVPTRLKMLRGNPGGRRLNRHEPQPPPVDDAFDTPPPLIAEDPLAAAEWARVAPMLRVCGMVTESERSALLALCQQWSLYLEAHAKVKQLGLLVKDPDGGAPLPNPFLAVADKALTHCKQLWGELGLTPSSRTRMSARVPVESVQQSKWAGLL